MFAVLAVGTYVRSQHPTLLCVRSQAPDIVRLLDRADAPGEALARLESLFEAGKQADAATELTAGDEAGAAALRAGAVREAMFVPLRGALAGVSFDGATEALELLGMPDDLVALLGSSLRSARFAASDVVWPAAGSVAAAGAAGKLPVAHAAGLKPEDPVSPLFVAALLKALKEAIAEGVGDGSGDDDDDADDDADGANDADGAKDTGFLPVVLFPQGLVLLAPGRGTPAALAWPFQARVDALHRSLRDLGLPQPPAHECLHWAARPSSNSEHHDAAVVATWGKVSNVVPAAVTWRDVAVAVRAKALALAPWERLEPRSRPPPWGWGVGWKSSATGEAAPADHAETPAPKARSDVDSMGPAELKAELKALGLSVNGKKDQLKKRLAKARKEAAAQAAPPRVEITEDDLQLDDAASDVIPASSNTLSGSCAEEAVGLEASSPPPSELPAVLLQPPPVSHTPQPPPAAAAIWVAPSTEVPPGAVSTSHGSDGGETTKSDSPPADEQSVDCNAQAANKRTAEAGDRDEFVDHYAQTKLAKAARLGDADAQFKLGEIFDAGEGVAQDCVKASHWYLEAAEQGHAEAQCKLAAMHEKGLGVEQDFSEAIHWFRRAAERGNASAHVSLGSFYASGKSVAQDFFAARECFLKAVELGDAEAQALLASMDEKLAAKATGKDATPSDIDAGISREAAEVPAADASEVGQDDNADTADKKPRKRELTALLKAAKQGDVEAQYQLGKMFDDGDGVDQDFDKAACYYTDAAEQGHAEAQFQLGIMHGNGQGVTRDNAEVLHWFRRAAERGHVKAQYNLGTMYDNGIGADVNYTEALRWYRMAADQGDSGSQFNIGAMYDNGHGIAQDDTEAQRWYRKAAENGNTSAQINLGSMHATGQGVAVDYNEARVWYLKAADQGDTQAQELVRNLDRKLISGSTTGDVDPALSEKTAASRGKSIETADISEDVKRAGVTKVDDALSGGDAPHSDVTANASDDGETVVAEKEFVDHYAIKKTKEAAKLGDIEAQFDLGVMYDTGKGLEQDFTAAVRWYSEAAEQGHAKAQFNLAVMYDKGQGVKQDYAEVAHWYRKAAERGHVQAQYNLATLYDSSFESMLGVGQDDVEASRWYEQAAAQGNINAQVNLASMHSSGQGIPQSFLEARKWYALAAEQGDPEAQELIHFIDQKLLEGKSEEVAAPVAAVEASETRAAAADTPPGTAPGIQEGAFVNATADEFRDEQGLKQYFALSLKAAKQGDSTAQFNVGCMYDDGTGGVEQDFEKAARWYSEAAEQGHAEAQFKLGIMYRNGLGVEQEDVEVVHWLRKAAERGHVQAQYNLGNMYDNGDGVEPSEEEAVRFYRMAADQGDAAAQFAVGTLFDNGCGVAQDDAAAMHWYRLAAESGHASAQINLGSMFAYGQGVPPDLTEAKRWYLRAAAQGEAKAVELATDMDREIAARRAVAPPPSDGGAPLAPTDDGGGVLANHAPIRQLFGRLNKAAAAPAAGSEAPEWAAGMASLAARKDSGDGSMDSDMVTERSDNEDESRGSSSNGKGGGGGGVEDAKKAKNPAGARYVCLFVFVCSECCL